MVRSRRSVTKIGWIAAVVMIAVTAGCGGGGSSIPTLTWYINPDNGGQAALAETCTDQAGGEYRIRTSLLPNDADGQREQLVRRLAANDSSIDIMSLDVVYGPEFAEAGFIRPFTDDDVAAELTDGVLDGPVETATWDDQLIAAPFYANTQLLWYRRSVAEAAGLDLENSTATWDQLVAAAEQTDTTVEVTGQRYEGYMVWINALVTSAGGEILADTEAGREARPKLDSDAGKTAATIIRSLARSSAADPELDVADETSARNGFQADDGGFLTLWPYVYSAAQSAVEDGSLDRSVLDDIGWARFPQSVAGTASTPPLGGINLAVGAFTNHPGHAVDAVRCLTTVESQTSYFLAEGNPASRSAVYDDADVREQFPFADLVRDSIADAGVRPLTPFYTDVSSAVQRDWSPPRSVSPDSTPARTDSYITAVLENRSLV